jgi:hypothetical protein
LNDVEAFEMNPHGMRGIGKPAVSEGVGREQVAEFVIEAGLRNAEDGDQAYTNCDYAESSEEYAEALVPCQAGKSTFERTEDRGLSAQRIFLRPEQNQRARSDQQQGFN